MIGWTPVCVCVCARVRMAVHLPLRFLWPRTSSRVGPWAHGRRLPYSIDGHRSTMGEWMGDKLVHMHVCAHRHVRKQLISLIKPGLTLVWYHSSTNL